MSWIPHGLPVPSCPSLLLCLIVGVPRLDPAFCRTTVVVVLAAVFGTGGAMGVSPGFVLGSATRVGMEACPRGWRIRSPESCRPTSNTSVSEESSLCKVKPRRRNRLRAVLYACKLDASVDAVARKGGHDEPARRSSFLGGAEAAGGPSCDEDDRPRSCCWSSVKMVMMRPKHQRKMPRPYVAWVGSVV